ncbi:uncharacterized protein cubi_01968 [Cryptosporidium ubiquitum]|uniref:Uncharacterized protein n=1 Tax=Cryptosporidium ubiquitum TaxID=857276 RepID=A0A1J4MN24_9CRYT|nr:uncharacterized protein cubi_01968 [Cryptosporidium ubiquitum]OII75447.1 hypothetical protein cubi_01968 [Cryptosporidium ubiquitum]
MKSRKIWAVEGEGKKKRLFLWTTIFSILGILRNTLVNCATITPTSMFVTQNMINTSSSFCWEYSGKTMYLPITSTFSTGWDNTLLIQFDLSKYSKNIRSSSTTSYLSLKTYCDSYNCVCNAKSLVLKFVKICEDLCSMNTSTAKDPSTVVSILETTDYASQDMQTSPATITIRTDYIFKYSGLTDIADTCNFKYFTLGIVNVGNCNAWVHVNSWTIDGI